MKGSETPPTVLPSRPALKALAQHLNPLDPVDGLEQARHCMGFLTALIAAHDAQTKKELDSPDAYAA